MAESGFVEGLPESFEVEGKPSPVQEVSGVLVLRDGGPDSPDLRSFNSRGRHSKAMPKSPLMRMAEMRRGGLRGRALRQSGLKILEGSDLKSAKGTKGKGGLYLQNLVPVQDYNVNKAAGMEAMEGEGGIEVSGAASFSRDSTVEGGPMRLELIPAGDNSDFALDLISAQPLQEMEFVGERLVSTLEVGATSGKDCMLEEINLQAGTGENTLLGVLHSELDEEFPPLSKEGLRAAKEKERNRGGGGREAGGALEQQPRRKINISKESPMGNPISNGESNK